MARRKKLSNRTLTRIAARRSGMFNQPGYRQGKRDRVRFGAYFLGTIGLLLTLFSGFSLLPLTIFLMAPAAFEILGFN